MIELPDEGYDLTEMSEDEKDEAIVLLGAAYNEAMAVGSGLYNALVILGSRLRQGDVLGKRGITMRDVAFRMTLIADLTLPALLDKREYEQMSMDTQFDDIVGGLDLDKE